jgi:hypothetical protein
MLRQIVLVIAITIVVSASTNNLSAELSPQGFTIPKEGFVPTADVATQIAEAVLVPVYGKDVVSSERPFHATLKGDVWIVTGTVPCQGAPSGAVCPGGNAEVRLSKKTGRIIYMMHSM